MDLNRINPGPELKDAQRSLFRLQFMLKTPSCPQMLVELEKGIFKQKLGTLTREEIEYLRYDWRNLLKIENSAYLQEEESLLSEISFMPIQDEYEVDTSEFDIE